MPSKISMQKFTFTNIFDVKVWPIVEMIEYSLVHQQEIS